MFTDYKIYKYPHDVLTTPCVPVDLTGASRSDAIQWILGMYRFYGKLAIEGNAVGLAANQVGRGVRVFIALGEIYVNPEITWVTKAPANLCCEGCLSLLDNKYDYPVKRASSIKLKWQDLDGNYHEQRFNGYTAQVIQHEMEHLNGKLCIHHA